MSRTNQRILIIGLCIVIFYACGQYVSDMLIKGNLAPYHSWTIEESKDGGYFINEYKPLTRKIKLTHHSDSVEFIRLWTEKERKKEKIWAFYKTILSGETYFQIDFRQFPSKEFLFDIDDYGGHGGQGTFDFKTDTIIFHIFERNPVDTIGWKEKLEGSEIKFVKLKRPSTLSAD